MKKIALLMVFVLVFSITCVFATEADLLISPAPDTAVSGELISGEDVEAVLSGENTENISGEDETLITESGEVVSGEPIIDDDNVNNDTTTPADNNEETEQTKSNNSSIIGAIIAIVIVVAVVAVAAILRKD